VPIAAQDETKRFKINHNNSEGCSANPIAMTLTEHTVTSSQDANALTLPTAVLEDLGLQPGGKVRLVKTEQGYLIVPCEQEHDRAMEIYQAESARYQDVYQALADG